LDGAEYLAYEFQTNAAGKYDVRLRVAANNNGKEVKVILFPPNAGSPFSKVLGVPNDGWNDFNDVFWNDVYLVKGYYKVQVYFVTGQTSKYRMRNKDDRNELLSNLHSTCSHV
jgi:hypothetical protein